MASHNPQPPTSPTPTTSSWQVWDGVLVVATGSNHQVPRAEQIFEHALRHPNPLLPPLPTALPGSDVELLFSPYPADVRVEIRLDNSGSGIGSQRAEEENQTNQQPVATVVALFDGTSLGALTAGQLDAGHLLHHGTWYPIARDDADCVATLLLKFGILSGMRLSLRHYLELRKQAATGSPLIVDLTGEALAASSGRWTPGHQPETITDLYPYQVTGLQWLRFVREEGIGGILADEMGLGKTVQIIALLLSPPPPEGQPALVVGPTSILENWRRELHRFAPGLRVLVHRGADRTGFPVALRSVDVVVTSYDVMVRDNSLLRQIEWTAVVLDEAQAIKNPQTQRTRAAKRLRRQVSLAVTGTPLENRLMDLWSLTDFVLPGFLGDAEHFERTYVDPPNGAAHVGDILAPLMLRRRVAEVAADLPSRIDVAQPLEMLGREAEQYESIREQVESDTGSSMSLAALTRLRMLCTHPVLVGAEATDLAAMSQKYERLTEILEEVRDLGEKALVFTAYAGMIDLLITDLPQRLDIPVTAIDGRTAPESRQQVVDDFTPDPAIGPQVWQSGSGGHDEARGAAIHYGFDQLIGASFAF